MRGAPSTAGSKILKGYQPPYDATVVARLEAAGAVLLGKLNCDEFAMGSSNENSAYGPVRNPWDPDRVPGAPAAARPRPWPPRSGRRHARHRYRRLHPPAGQLLRSGRRDAHLRARLALRADRLRLLARPDRAVRAQRARCRHAARRHRRPRSAATPPAPRRPCRTTRAESDKAAEGLRIGVPAEYFGEGLDPDVRDRHRERHRVAEGRRLHASSRCRCRTPATRSPPTTSSPRPKPAPTSPASTASATATVRRRPPRSRTCTAIRATRASAPRSSAASCWAPTRSPPATTTPTTSRRRRCGACWPTSSCGPLPRWMRSYADRAHSRVQAGREDGRSPRHVSRRYLYGHGEPGRHLRRHRSLRHHQAGLPVGMQVLARHLNESTAFRVARAVEAAQTLEIQGVGSGAVRYVPRRVCGHCIGVLALCSGFHPHSMRRRARRMSWFSARSSGCRIRKPAIRPAPLAGEDAFKIRPLVVDGAVKEWTTGESHDVTDRSFVVRRVLRLNDHCPARSQSGATGYGSAGRGCWWIVSPATSARSSCPITIPA